MLVCSGVREGSRSLEADYFERALRKEAKRQGIIEAKSSHDPAGPSTNPLRTPDEPKPRDPWNPGWELLPTPSAPEPPRGNRLAR